MNDPTDESRIRSNYKPILLALNDSIAEICALLQALKNNGADPMKCMDALGCINGAMLCISYAVPVGMMAIEVGAGPGDVTPYRTTLNCDLSEGAAESIVSVVKETDSN